MQYQKYVEPKKKIKNKNKNDGYYLSNQCSQKTPLCFFFLSVIQLMSITIKPGTNKNCQLNIAMKMSK
jgi:hypothetical protein